MADVNANIGVEIDASNALAQLKALQRGLSNFHTSIARSSDAAAAAQRSLQKNLVDSINSIGGFSAELRTVRTTAESFTNSLEKNKFSMREYFRYAGASTKTFGRLFTSEFDTITKVAEDRVKRMQTQYIKMGRDASGAMKAIAVIPDKLDMSNYSTQLQMAAQRQALLNQLIKQGSTNLLNFGKNTQWAGRQLMVGFTLPLMTLGSTASKVFMDMETAAIKFRKVYGDLFTPAAETEKALQDIKNLGQEFTKYGIAVSKTMDLAAAAAAAGFQGLDLQRQTEQATRLAILGQIDQQKALETTISLQNAFKTSSADLAEQINFLNAVENQTVTSLDDITTAIPKVAPVIQQLGGDVKDLAFFLTAMREGGINASEGANALKSGLGSLINPSKKAAGMLADMGININKIVESNKGNLRETVVEFAQALDTLDPLNRARAIEQLFGKFQFARLSALFANVITEGNQASKVLDLAGESASNLAFTAEKELGITANSAMNKFKKAIEDLKVAIAPVGKVFLEVVTPLIDIVTKIAEKFNSWSEGTQKAVARIVFVVGGIGPVVLMTFGLIANALANIIKVANMVRNGFLRLSGQSTVLGEQTQYLTSEQLENAAVASSLDQAHSSLTQQFTVEASALERLIGVYQRANVAANNFRSANPGMFASGKGIPPIRKAGGGKISGPGTATSDSIPAYLSNGEYVVQASAVDKYGPGFFDALNAKKFAKGGIVPKLATGTTGGVAAVIKEMLSGIGGLRSAKLRSGAKSGKASGTARSSRKLVDEAYDPISRARTAKDLEMKQKLKDTYGARFSDDLILGHVYTPTFLKQFRSGALKGESPLVSGIEAQMLGAVGATSRTVKASGQYQALPRTFINIPEELNKNLLRGADKSLWRNVDGADMVSFLYELMLMGVDPEDAKKLAGDLASDINAKVARHKGNINSMDLGRIYEKSLSSIFKRNTGFLSRFSFRGYSNGTNNVPGSGNKDTVPAMLTPGEAVIPKEQNRKYGALVRGIIADNIPGFAKGEGEVKSAYERRKNKPIGGVLAPTAINTAHPEGLFSILDISSQDASQILSMGMQDIVKQTPGTSLKGIEDEVKAWKERNADLLKEANKRALAGVDLDEAFLDVRKKFNKDMEDLGGNVHKLKVSSEKHLPRLTKDFEEAQAHARKMGLDLRTAEGVTRLAADLPNNAIAQQITTRGKFQSYNTPRAAAMAGMGGSFTQYGIPDFFVIDKSLEDLRVSTEHLSTTVQAQADREQTSRGRETRQQVVERRSTPGVLDKGSKKRQKGKAKRKRGTPATPSVDAPIVIGDMSPETGKDKMSQMERDAASRQEETGTKTKAKTSRRSMLGKIKGKFGFSGAGSMLSFIAPQIIDQIPDKLGGVDVSIAKTMGKFAAFGAMFGPWGAAAGAAIGAASGLMGKLGENAEKVKSTNEAIAAGFTASTSVAKLFGGTASATIDSFTAMPGTVDKVTEALIKAKEQADQFKTIIEQLDQDDPLKKFIDGIKGLSGTQLTGRIRSFVSTQIATGALPVEEAKQFTLNILTAAGAADQFATVWASISSSVSTTAKAINTQYQKLGQAYTKAKELTQEEKNRIADLERSKKNYIATDGTVLNPQAIKAIEDQIDSIKNKTAEGTKAAENYGNALATFFANIRAGNISAKDMNATFIAISKSGLSATEQMNALGQAILSSNNEELIANWNRQKIVIDQISGSLKNAANAAKATFAALFFGNTDPSQILNDYYKGKGLEAPSGQGRQLVTAETWAKAYLYQFSKLPKPLQNALGGGGKPGGGTPSGGTGPSKLVSLVNKEIEALKKKADALKAVNDEMKRNNEYQSKQLDLSNQIALAKASGDYIGATILQQQQAFNTAEFNKETEYLKLQQRISNLENIAKKLESGEKLSSVEKTLIGSLTTKYSGAKAATGGLIRSKRYASGGLIKGPGTGTSDSIMAMFDSVPRFYGGGAPIRVSNGEFIVKKEAVDYYTPEVMNSINNKSFQPASNSVVYNNINIDVSGVQDPKQAADIVMQRLQTISNKTNRTNMVSNNRSIAI